VSRFEFLERRNIRSMPASLKRQHWSSAVKGALIALPLGCPWPRRDCDIKVGTYIPRRTGYHSTGNTRLDARTHLSTYLVLSIPLIPDHSCDLLLHTSLLIAVVDDRVYTPRLTTWGFFGVWTSPTSATTHHNSLTAGR
jgi:hypothetical protein